MSNIEAICHTDGGARGNPGPAAIGVVIKHVATNRTFNHSKYLGKQTNNYAEYSAVIYCLEKLKEAKINNFELYADSELLVKQINGEYQVKSKNILPLYRKIKELLTNFKEYKFIHVRRKYNAGADKLVNIELDKIENS